MVIVRAPNTKKGHLKRLPFSGWEHKAGRKAIASLFKKENNFYAIKTKKRFFFILCAQSQADRQCPACHPAHRPGDRRFTSQPMEHAQWQP
jgi:hypothetical protein